jgi:hypothetical protein
VSARHHQAQRAPYQTVTTESVCPHLFPRLWFRAWPRGMSVYRDHARPAVAEEAAWSCQPADHLIYARKSTTLRGRLPAVRGRDARMSISPCQSRSSVHVPSLDSAHFPSLPLRASVLNPSARAGPGPREGWGSGRPAPRFRHTREAPAIVPQHFARCRVCGLMAHYRMRTRPARIQSAGLMRAIMFSGFSSKASCVSDRWAEHWDTHQMTAGSRTVRSSSARTSPSLDYAPERFRPCSRGETRQDPDPVRQVISQRGPTPDGICCLRTLRLMGPHHSACPQFVALPSSARCI